MTRKQYNALRVGDRIVTRSEFLPYYHYYGAPTVRAGASFTVAAINCPSVWRERVTFAACTENAPPVDNGKGLTYHRQIAIFSTDLDAVDIVRME